MNRPTASRALDPASGICAVRLAGCAPHDLLDRQDVEVSRDHAEGVRLAYVAATRARDLLVVPGVGDGPHPADGWLAPLHDALYPAVGHRRIAQFAPGCPPFKLDSVLQRGSDGDPWTEHTVRPGLHTFRSRFTDHGSQMADHDPPSTDLGLPVADRGSQITDHGTHLLDLAQSSSFANHRARFAARTPNPESQTPISARSSSIPDPVSRIPDPVDPSSYHVVWWDPLALQLDVEPPGGLRRAELIVKEGSELLDADALAAYREWQQERGTALAHGSAPTLRVRTITEWAHSGDPWPLDELMPEIEAITLRQGNAYVKHGLPASASLEDSAEPSARPRRSLGEGGQPRAGSQQRPRGRHFGVLVHAVLATVPLDASPDVVSGVVRLEGRLLVASNDEVMAAATLVGRVLQHDLLAAARAADRRGACRRECPVTVTSRDGSLLEGIVDLLFEHDGVWTVVDFKTDEDPSEAIDAYRRQVALYAAALVRAGHRATRSVVLIV
jgi:hypothetical protein